MKKTYNLTYLKAKYPPDSIDFIDKRVQKISISFLINILSSTTSSITASRNYLLMFRYINQYVAPSLSLNEIKSSDIRYLLYKIVENNLYNRTLLVKYIYILLNSEYTIMDNESKSFLNIESFFNKETPMNAINKILSVKHFNQLFYFKYRNQGNLMVLPIESTEILNLCKDFIFNYNRVDGFIQDFFMLFSNCTDNSIRSINDFTFSLFKEHLNYFRNKCKNRNFVLLLCSLYYFVWSQYKPDLFSEGDYMNPAILERHDIVGLLFNGFMPITYNSLAPVPNEDKWIFDYSNLAYRLNSRNSSCSRKMDFSSIYTPFFRNLLKKYIWENDSQPDNKYSLYLRLTEFLVYVEQLKGGQQLSIYTKPNNEKIITAGEVLAYRSYISNKIKSAHNNLVIVKQFLTFLSQNKYMKITKDVMYSLDHIVEPVQNTSVPIPDNEITVLARTLLSHSGDSTDAALYCVAFYLALETEFRISMIFSLSADCVKPTYKANEYVIESTTKTHPCSPKTFPITLETKQKIDLILSLNKNLREHIRGTAYNYLFTSTSRRNKMYESVRILGSEGFNTYLKKCCREANIPLYTSENLRDTHMTKATEYLIENNLSKFYEKYLTDHSSVSMTEAHYVNFPLVTILESTYGIIIGDLDVPGQVSEKLDAHYKSEENIVQDSCGYCKSPTCNTIPLLSCLLCPDFVATIDRIPFFKKQIQICDIKISNANIPHDIEDLMNIKNLLLKYLYCLYDLNERINNND